MESELFQGGVLMHSYLRAVGFSKITKRSSIRQIMAVEHTEYPIYGVQFHPESVMTPDGKVMIQNFINVVKK